MLQPRSGPRGCILPLGAHALRDVVSAAASPRGAHERWPPGTLTGVAPRRTLRDPSSRVAIEGFADRLGQRWYNRQLSAMRATNLAQALIDCTGGDLVAKTVTRGHGEDVLASLGEAFFPDEKGSEQWRRGFVVLNAQVAATMGTNDPKVKRPTRPK